MQDLDRLKAYRKRGLLEVQSVLKMLFVTVSIQELILLHNNWSSLDAQRGINPLLMCLLKWRYLRKKQEVAMQSGLLKWPGALATEDASLLPKLDFLASGLE
jgi:hypothetical protein